MVSILRRLECILRLGLLFMLITACASKPDHILVATNESDYTPSKAERYQTRAQEVPDAVKKQIEIGLGAYEKGDYDQAIRVLERAQRMAPKYSDTYLYLGDVYIAKQQRELAEQMYRRAESLATDRNQRSAAQQALQAGGF